MKMGSLISLVKKEFLHLLRDRGLLPMVILAPLIQLIMFGYVVSTDVENLSVAIVNQDRQSESRKIINQIDATEFFNAELFLDSKEDMEEAILKGAADAGVIFPPNFTRDALNGRPTSIHIIVDGSDPNAGNVALTYLTALVEQQNIEIITERLPRPLENATPTLNESIRVWYNPSLKSVNFMIPGLIGFILSYITIILTAVAIVREKERGTLEQLIVTPIKRHELLLGKMIPFVVIGLFDVALVTVVGVFWFNVPFRGNWLVFLLMSFLFLISTLGAGLFASTVSRTQQQAMVSAMFLMLASMLLSGFIFPVENMPRVIQLFSYLIPLTYYELALRGIFLKGVGFQILWQAALALLSLGILIFFMSLNRFKKRFVE